MVHITHKSLCPHSIFWTCLRAHSMKSSRNGLTIHRSSGLLMSEKMTRMMELVLRVWGDWNKRRKILMPCPILVMRVMLLYALLQVVMLIECNSTQAYLCVVWLLWKRLRRKRYKLSRALRQMQVRKTFPFMLVITAPCTYITLLTYIGIRYRTAECGTA